MKNNCEPMCDRRPAGGSDDHSGRRPYQKPAVTFRELVEVIGATCAQPGGKNNFGACPSGPINS